MVFLYCRIMVGAVLMQSAKTSEMGNAIVHAILDIKEMGFNVQGLSVELVSFFI